MRFLMSWTMNLLLVNLQVHYLFIKMQITMEMLNLVVIAMVKMSFYLKKALLPVKVMLVWVRQRKCVTIVMPFCGRRRVNKNVKRGLPEFSICCSKGQIRLPKTPPTPSYLMQIYNDPEWCNKFKRLIHLYNSMFAFTSMGGKVDHSINIGGAPYIYRLNGQNHHVVGTLIPDDSETPKFCQL